MFTYQGTRKVWLAALAAGLFTVAGCSNQPEQATNQPAPAPAKKAAPKQAPVKAQQPAQPAKTAKQVNASAKVAPAAKLVTVPKGTAISATLGQGLASNKNKAGDSFSATVASSVKVNGKTVIPKGAQLTGKVVSAQKKNPAALTVVLSSVEINGKAYSLATNSVGPTNKVSTDDSAKQKNVTLSAKSQLKFKLSKSAKVPVTAKG
jgi:glucose/arabinose dehydrogenase